MNGGVKILLARMETNPEEFENDGKWISGFNNYKKYMTDEEREAVTKKLSEIKMAKFEQMVVKTLVRTEGEKDDSFVTYTLGDTSHPRRFTATQTDVMVAKQMGISLSEWIQRREGL